MSQPILAAFDYSGHEVRVVTVNGDPWFVATDVLATLDLDRTAYRRLDDDERGVASIHTPGGDQSVSTINEAGLYALILGSRKPEAKPFKRWITHEVLPSIRKTGTYSAPADDLALPHDYLSALEALVERERQNLALAAQNAELTPRAEAWNAIASAEGDYSVADAAKVLARAGIQTGPQRLFGQLDDLGWIFRGSEGSWRAYAHRVDKGHLFEKPQFHYHPASGERVLDPPQVRVTLKGVDQLRRRLSPGHLRAVSA